MEKKCRSEKVVETVDIATRKMSLRLESTDISFFKKLITSLKCNFCDTKDENIAKIISILNKDKFREIIKILFLKIRSTALFCAFIIQVTVS